VTTPSKKIVCFGPGPRFKGGIQNYNTSLALALDAIGWDVTIVSWTQQYPAIIPREFVDKSSQTDLLEGSGVKVVYLTNYNNPFTWRQTARYIKQLKPDKVVFQWSIALQGLPLGYLVKRLKVANMEVMMDLHFVIQKENAFIDQWFTKRGIAHASTYVVHALKTYQELQVLFPNRTFHLTESGERSREKSTVLKLYHPIYNLFKPDGNFDIVAFKKKHGLNQFVFLFFGFIRRYKGLDQALQAFSQVAAQRDDVSFLICGESFWQTLDQNSWTTKFKNFLFNAAKRIFLKKQDDERNDQPLKLIEQLRLEKQCASIFSSGRCSRPFLPDSHAERH
jgi:glycosyltransferase involved in cell wall biosynthesis